MKEVLERLYQHERLSRAEAHQLLVQIAQGEFKDEQVASFLTAFIMRGIELEELAGFRDAMLELCVSIDLSAYDPMDLCGTGGDGKDTFNISTLSSFVVAAAGIPVAKHGNYGVSSISGSSNMIESFGYEFTNDEDKLKKKMDKVGICFLHAPLFHPAMKNVAPVRRAMGVKTFFNMLGPLSNPAKVKKQITGTFNLEVARLYGYLMQRENKDFTIIHALDGYDEISLTGNAKLITNKGERLVSPADLGFKPVVPGEIKGGKTVKQSAKIFKKILKAKGSSAQNNVIIANAGLAIQVAKPHLSQADAFALAEETLLSKKAWKTFKKFVD